MMKDHEVGGLISSLRNMSDTALVELFEDLGWEVLGLIRPNHTGEPKLGWKDPKVIELEETRAYVRGELVRRGLEPAP
jgi:hypothetical protein